MTTVLVTGTGAVIGYGVLNSLRARGDIRLIATDVHPEAVGQHFADAFFQAPYTSDVSYRDWLQELIQKQNVDLLIPGIEQDVSWLAEISGSGSELPTKVCLNRPDVVRLCSDKIEFDKYLEGINDPLRIPSSLNSDYKILAEQLGVPFLLKPRNGYAGKGIVRTTSEDEFLIYAPELGSRYLAQKIIGDRNSEFTVSAYCIGGEVRAIIALRRFLSAEGATSWAERVDARPFLLPIQRLSQNLGAEGPTNFQFRIEGEKAYLLEINPRISSSTSIRAAFGFNEASMCVDHYLFGLTVKQPELKNGTATRYLADMVKLTDDCNNL